MKVTVHTAKTQLIEADLRGEEVLIARGKDLVARLVPVENPKFAFGLLEGEVATIPDFLEPMDEDDLRAWEGR